MEKTRVAKDDLLIVHNMPEGRLEMELDGWTLRRIKPIMAMHSATSS